MTVFKAWVLKKEAEKMIKIPNNVKLGLFVAAAMGVSAGTTHIVTAKTSENNERNARNEAIVAGELDAEQAKKLEALAKWELKLRSNFNSFNTDMVSIYKEYSAQFNAGKTYEEISKPVVQKLNDIEASIAE